MSAIIVCELCGTKYKVDFDQIPDEGRKVRCASCGNVWFHSPFFEGNSSTDVDDDLEQEKEQQEIDEEEDDFAEQVFEADDSSEEEGTIEDEEAADLVDDEEPEEEVAVVKVREDKEERKQGSSVRTKIKGRGGEVKQSSSVKPASCWWLKAVTGVNLAVLIILSIGSFKGEFPGFFEPLYDVLGLHNTYFLEFDNVHVTREGSRDLVIKAQIINNSNTVKKVPKVRIRLVDGSGKVVFSDYLKVQGEGLIERDARYSFTKKINLIPRRSVSLIMDLGNGLEMMLS